MKEHGMIFNAAMVRAIMNGSKTQTRRTLTARHLDLISLAARAGECYPLESDQQHANSQSYYREFCPFGAEGDRLWVRETWSDVNLEGISAVAYRADEGLRFLTNDDDDGDEDDPRLEKYSFANWYPDLISGTEGIWRPSIHMPRWASRITLEITGVRVERLASVSNEDARAEGYPADRAVDGGNSDPWLWFRDLWDGIYPEQSFKVNPWVWVIEFKRAEGE